MIVVIIKTMLVKRPQEPVSHPEGGGEYNYTMTQCSSTLQQSSNNLLHVYVYKINAITNATC